MNFNILEVLCVTPLICLLLFSLVPISWKVFGDGIEMRPITALAWCVIGLISAAGLNLSLVNGYWLNAGYNYVEIFSGLLVVDGITVWANFIIFIIVGFCLFLVYDSKATKDHQFGEHLFLIMNSTIGMSLLVMANNLLMTFMALELMSLSVYLIIALNKERVLSKEASFKYFVLGSLGSAIFLYGLAFLYGGAGTLSLHQLGENLASLYQGSSIFRFGVIMTFVGFAFKVSLVPFHSWTPDVYQGAATPITSIMATAMKVAGFVAFLRFFMYADFFNIPNDHFYGFMQWIAALTMIVGNLAAIRQENFKRMLAYSSIAHSGYAFMGIIAATFGQDGDGGITSLLFYLFSYSVMTVGTLALVNVFERSEKTVLLMSDLKGLAKRSPGLALSLSLLLFSLAGLPPSIGFFGKFYVFAAALEQGLHWLVVMGVLSSVIGLYYYLRPIVMMYMVAGEAVEENREAFFSRSLVYLSAFAVTTLGMLSSHIFEFVYNSVASSL